MVSYDVVPLFTKVTTAVSLELSHLLEDDVLASFKHVLTYTYFCFVGQFYEQTNKQSSNGFTAFSSNR